jgi:hypothetical protein
MLNGLRDAEAVFVRSEKGAVIEEWWALSWFAQWWWWEWRAELGGGCGWGGCRGGAWRRRLRRGPGLRGS